MVGATANQRRQHLDTLFENHQHCVEELNIFLCSFGRALYEGGRPFNHFIESLNAITIVAT